AHLHRLSTSGVAAGAGALRPPGRRLARHRAHAARPGGLAVRRVSGLRRPGATTKCVHSCPPSTGGAAGIGRLRAIVAGRARI
ncbi:MAG: COG2740: Predicted nucleic-acid-binding protein implicated in transcription termination, partial [uncultured Acidimicrobiales bacterium]